MNTQLHYQKIVIITCCLDDWGGSEELWARAIPLLLQQNAVEIIVYKKTVNRSHPALLALAKQGVTFREFDPVLSSVKKIIVKTGNLLKRIGDNMNIYSYSWNKPVARVRSFFKKDRPDLVLVAQGINFDGLAYGYQCLQLKIPYVVVSQKAVDFYWPEQHDRYYMRETLLNAEGCFFVSQHNKKLTEEQFGIRLPDSQVIFNPIKIKAQLYPYPSVNEGYRIACVGRLFIIDKGQDILLRILSQEKWKKRPIIVSFVGTGPDKQALQELATLLKVTNVEFKGHQENIEDLWSAYHALILPSRSEGLPLAMMEAMAVGRPVIVTDAGGNAEVIKNEVNGFISACNEKAFDEAMEKAWDRRDQWEAIGRNACNYIAATVPKSPEKVFAGFLEEILNKYRSLE